jgi:hypothetical protein
MFLGSYDFDGDPAGLLPAYERLLAQYPPDGLDLHVCVIREGGITVYDACPSRADFDGFLASGEFHAAVAAAGLPVPRVSGLGEVHRARIRQPAGR